MKRKQVYAPPELHMLMNLRPSSLLTSLSASADVGDFGWEDSYAGDFGGDDSGAGNFGSGSSGVGGFGGGGSGAGNFGSGTW